MAPFWYMNGLDFLTPVYMHIVFVQILAKPYLNIYIKQVFLWRGSFVNLSQSIWKGVLIQVYEYISCLWNQVYECAVFFQTPGMIMIGVGFKILTRTPVTYAALKSSLWRI